MPENFVADQQERMHTAHTAVRENLWRAADRRKNNYDLQIRKQDISVDIW